MTTFTRRERRVLPDADPAMPPAPALARTVARPGRRRLRKLASKQD